MQNENIYEDDYFILLTIDGSTYEGVEVKVNDPNKTIREQIKSIVQVFELPKMDGGGNPVNYQLALVPPGDVESMVLEPEDENGREQVFEDYNIQSGDHLHLITVPIAGAMKCM